MANKFNLENFTGGWFIGDFEPSIFRNTNFEVAVKRLKSGTREPVHYQKTVVEITVVISGKCILAGIEFGPNEIVKLDPMESASFEAIEDCVLVSIKFPSIPNDKALGSK